MEMKEVLSFKNSDLNLSRQKPPNLNVYWLGSMTGKKQTNKQKIVQSQNIKEKQCTRVFSLLYNVS